MSFIYLIYNLNILYLYFICIVFKYIVFIYIVFTYKNIDCIYTVNGYI